MDKLTKQEIASLINNNNPTILDVGTHTGKDAALMAREFDQCTVHCFEADPRMQREFLKARSINGKLKLYPFALGAINGMLEFFPSVGRNIASGSIHQPKEHLAMFPDVTFDPPIKVRCQALDRWYFLNLHPKMIDFIWCDVNGAEGDFIRGGKYTLEFHTRFLYIEFCEKELYEGALTRRQIISMLPTFREIGVYNFEGNYGNVLLQNKNV